MENLKLEQTPPPIRFALILLIFLILACNFGQSPETESPSQVITTSLERNIDNNETPTTNAKESTKQERNVESKETPAINAKESTKETASASHDVPELSQPISSSALAVSSNGKFIAAVNPDSDSITLIDAISSGVLDEIPVGDDPRTLSFTPDSEKILVANNGSSSISVVDIASRTEEAQYSVGLMPYGVVSDGLYAFVSEFGSGNISIFKVETGILVKRIKVDPFPAGLALSKDAKTLFVTHFFSGAITVIERQKFRVMQTITLGSDTNLSQFIAITPNGEKAYVPQTRSNITNTALLFDTTEFPIVNVVDTKTLSLLVKKRITLDTADEPVNMPFALVFSPSGKTLYLANAGSNDISVIDLNTNRGIGHINVGSNPRGIAITPDGARIFVNNVLDGNLSVINTETLKLTDEINLTDIPLPKPILDGKRIFNSAAIPELTTDNWISCATCHFDGMMDARTWLDFPDGPRNTPNLLGVMRTPPFHWSGDFDELHDVELTIRDIQFGTGLVKGSTQDSLGTPHAGLSEELDALVTYMTTLKPIGPQGSTYSESKNRGLSIFNSLGCDSCHVPPLYTDQILHDVGTGDPEKEKNSHNRGLKFDTPSLIGLWLTAPYFHDGSASTLEDVLQIGTVHNVHHGLNPEDVNNLIEFLLNISHKN